MKRLFLLRHAKAGAGEPGGDDFDRPLAPRGRRAAPRIGDYMRNQNYRPEIALCSPALRTIQTWELVQAGLDIVPVTQIETGLYLGHPNAHYDRILNLDDRFGTAIVIGHNPAMLTLALGLIGRGTSMANPFGKFATAALAVFDFETENWRGVAPGQGKLVGFTRPKELDALA